MATKKGIWVTLPGGVKEIIDTVSSIKNVTRKRYCLELIEDRLAADLAGVENIDRLFDSINLKLGTAYRDLQARVNARQSGVEVVQADEGEEADDYAADVDLPEEITSPALER